MAEATIKVFKDGRLIFEATLSKVREMGQKPGPHRETARLLGQLPAEIFESGRELPDWLSGKRTRGEPRS
jgi:hypothetical protein